MRHPYEALFREFFIGKLKEYRRSHGLTQEKMAEKLSITHRPYTYIESGKGCSATTLLFFISLMSEEELLRFRQEFRALLKSEGNYGLD